MIIVRNVINENMKKLISHYYYSRIVELILQNNNNNNNEITIKNNYAQRAGLRLALIKCEKEKI